MRPVLILGGYGNFGKRIVAALVASGVPVIVAGRRRDKAEALRAQLASPLVQTACFEVPGGLDAELAARKPSVAVNTCGPFQGCDYAVAEACLRNGVHYLDLADGRAFVRGISALNEAARARGVAVISGASTVPGLSSAVVEHFKADFARIESMRFGISPGQQAERGRATTQGILTYVGKPLEPFPGPRDTAYGWQDLHRQVYPDLGPRWMANCEIPDLDLLPARYGIKSIQFSAGLELGLLHLGLWGLSWLVRAGLPLNLPRFAGLLLRASNGFNTFGSADGGMHVVLTGIGRNGEALTRTWFIVARQGDGPHIPTVPAIVLARTLARGEAKLVGALPCVGLVSLDDYLRELRPYAIRTHSALSAPA